MIATQQLCFRYQQSEALHNLTFSIAAGDYVLLAGPNGAGKSTLIRLLLGLVAPSSGTIQLFGFSPRQFRDWHRVGYLPQRVNLFNPLFPATVQEVVALGLLARQRFPKRLKAQERERIHDALRLMAIENLAKRPVSQLSGGQQQRLFLARALVGRPHLLILDEPSGALDPQIRQYLFRLLAQLHQEKGMTIILVTHDVSEIGRYASQLLYLDHALIFYGAVSKWAQAPQRRRFMGRTDAHL